MIYCIFSQDMMEAPCVCKGIPTIVGKESNPQIGSLLPISLSPISNRYTPNIIIGITNSRISIRVIVT